MKQTKHTPGSWRAKYHESGNDVQGGLAGWSINGNGEGIAYNVSREANARLIATAPELLAMCKEFVFLEKTNMTKKQTQLRIDMAKDVIAKAEEN